VTVLVQNSINRCTKNTAYVTILAGAPVLLNFLDATTADFKLKSGALPDEPIKGCPGKPCGDAAEMPPNNIDHYGDPSKVWVLNPINFVVQRGGVYVFVEHSKSLDKKAVADEVSQLRLVTTSQKVLLGCNMLWKSTKVQSSFRDWSVLENGQTFNEEADVKVTWAPKVEGAPKVAKLQFIRKVKRLGCTSKKASPGGVTVGESAGACQGMTVSRSEGFLRCPPHLPGENMQLKGILTKPEHPALLLGDAQQMHGTENKGAGRECTTKEDPVNLIKGMICATIGDKEGCCVQKMLTPDHLSPAQAETHHVSLAAW